MIELNSFIPNRDFFIRYMNEENKSMMYQKFLNI